MTETPAHTLRKLQLTLMVLKQDIDALTVELAYYQSLKDELDGNLKNQEKCFSILVNGHQSLDDALEKFRAANAQSIERLEDVSFMCSLMGSKDFITTDVTCKPMELPDLPAIRPGDNIQIPPINPSQVPRDFFNYVPLCPVYGAEQISGGVNIDEAQQEKLKRMADMCKRYRQQRASKICEEFILKQ